MSGLAFWISPVRRGGGPGPWRCRISALPGLRRWASLLGLFLAAPNASAAPVEWMWAAGDRHAAAEVELRRDFRIEILPEGDVTLRALGDFCGLDVAVNGRRVLSLEPYEPTCEVSVRRWLRVGDNAIIVRAKGVEGPSAMALALVGPRDGGPIVASGAGWEGAVALGSLEPLRLGDPGLAAIGALDEYNQWKEAGGVVGEAKFSSLPDGFRLERLRAAGPNEGSWISMAFDPRGRLVISAEARGLFRLDPGAGDGGGLDWIDNTLLECRGLLFAHGALYANANNSLGLYRLRDADADDRYEDVRLLMKTEGGVGHGRNDLALGPEGLLYAIHGDSVSLPTDLRRRVPLLPDDRGEQGYLVRFDADGRQREVLAIGLRNPYGIAFNPEGEAFTYDADNEGDIGLPLYRPARVNHLVSGGNYGWQQGHGESWPVYAPDSLPTSLDAGRGSPTAVAFGTGSNFPPRYRDALFLLDWAYGRIIAVEVIPRGASYLCQAETFLRGRPLNVTDLAFGPDGALYFITGGRGTQSALYRIAYEGKHAAGSAPGAQEVARNAFSKDARALRRGLERFHGSESPEAVPEVWPHLGSPDPWIRNAARVALESQPVDAWAGRATAGAASPGALLALARRGRDAASRALAIDFSSLSHHEKLAVLRVLDFRLEGESAPDENARMLAYLSPLFPDGSPPVDRELSRLLVALGDPGAVPTSLALLAGAESQFESLHYLEVLSRARGGWTPEGRRAFFGSLRYPEYFVGDSNMPGFVRRIRERAVAGLSGDERLALGPLLDPVGADAVPEPPAAPRPVVRHWKVDDLLGPPDDAYRPDAARGREVFEMALCSRCHQANGLGTAVGPNLTAVAARFTRRDLVEAIVEPSRAMAESFRNLILTMHDGTTVVGRVVRDDFRESTLSLAPNPFAPADLTVVAKRAILSHEASPVSPMPPGLLDTFSRDEILQLLDFLERPVE